MSETKAKLAEFYKHREALRQQIAELERQRQNERLAELGLSVGATVCVRGKEYAVAAIDSFTEDYEKPWLYGFAKLRGGKLSTYRTRLYSNWKLPDAEESEEENQ